MQKLLRHILFIAIVATCLKAQDSQPASRAWPGPLSEAEFAALHELRQGAEPTLHGTMVDVAGAKAYLSLPKAKPSAAILVIHEWWGLNANIKHWADRLASDGYAALAIDLYGGTVATKPDQAMAAMKAVDSEKALATLKAAHHFLMRDPRVQARRTACIGWCFGGAWSLQLAIAEPELDAAIIYYGQLVDDPERLATIRAPMLGVFGSKDRSIPPAAVDAFEAAMKKAGKSLRVIRYDANHAFANPSSARYEAKHAANAWDASRTFLRRHLLLATGTFRAADKLIQYELSPGWAAGARRPMRDVNVRLDDGTECYVTVLGGNGGGITANVNRWRTQMGQPALSDAQIDKLPRFEMLGRKAIEVTIDGDYTDMQGGTTPGTRTIAVVCRLDGATLFVKMLGKKEDVARHEAAFRTFCRSMTAVDR